MNRLPIPYARVEAGSGPLFLLLMVSLLSVVSGLESSWYCEMCQQEFILEADFKDFKDFEDSYHLSDPWIFPIVSGFWLKVWLWHGLQAGTMLLNEAIHLGFGAGIRVAAQVLQCGFTLGQVCQLG